MLPLTLLYFYFFFSKNLVAQLGLFKLKLPIKKANRPRPSERARTGFFCQAGLFTSKMV
jgi:hypothetical protein